MIDGFYEAPTSAKAGKDEKEIPTDTFPWRPRSVFVCGITCRE